MPCSAAITTHVQEPLKLHVGCVGSSWGVKRPKPELLSLGRNLCRPAVALLVNTKESRLAVGLGAAFVLGVKLVTCLSKILDSVVVAQAVTMIDVTFGPRACDVEPDQPMSRVQDAVYADNTVAVFPDATRNAPNFCVRSGFCYPDEHTRNLVVTDKSAKPASGEVLRVHAAPSKGVAVNDILPLALTLAFNSL